MKTTTRNIFDELFQRYPSLMQVKENILDAYNTIKSTYESGGTLYVCGNGGSASDSEHIVGELLKSFKKPRKIDSETARCLSELGDEGRLLLNTLEGSLPAVCLTSQTGVISAFANDRAWNAAFAQQLYGLGQKGDCLLALSTSGNSKNCVYAAVAAKSKEIKTVALTGGNGGKLKEICDACVTVPEKETYKIQELHLPIYHCICAMLEEEFFD